MREKTGFFVENVIAVERFLVKFSWVEKIVDKDSYTVKWIYEFDFRLQNGTYDIGHGRS